MKVGTRVYHNVTKEIGIIVSIESGLFETWFYVQWQKTEEITTVRNARLLSVT